jgi:hypothetical protein
MPSETPGHDLDDGAKLETIRIFTSRESADIAAANLRAHGIQCWINTDDGGGMLPNLAAPEGVRLLVQASEAQTAGSLLEEQSLPDISGPAESEVDVQTPEANVPRRSWAPGQILLGIVVGVLLCLFYQWGIRRGISTHYHHAQNGKPDEKWVYRDGYLTEFIRDRNHDGAWDQWAYYEHGRVVRSELDNNFDGKPDETWFYSNGIVVRMEKDRDFNGTPDEFCTYKNGIIDYAEIRPNGALFPTQRQLYQNGVLVEILRNPNGSGGFKESVRYDPFLNPISTNKLE